jgi:uncharacterized membrane protein YfcA
MALSFPDIAILIAVFVLAGFVKGAIGLGLPTIAMGLLGAWFSPATAAAILILPALLTNVWQMAAGPNLVAIVRRHVLMYVFAILGTLLAIGIITNANTRVATALLGLVLISYAVVGLSGWRFVIRGKSEFWLGQIVGLVSGILNGATGVFVIPSAPFLQAVHRDKDEFVQAIAVSAFVFAVALALGLGLNSALDSTTLVSGTVALVAAIGGMMVGQALRARLASAVFQNAVFAGLLALGVTMVVRGVLVRSSVDGLSAAKPIATSAQNPGGFRHSASKTRVNALRLNPPYALRRVRRPDPPGNLAALLALHDRDVVLALQVEPELRAVAEIAAEPHRRVCCDRAAAVENVGDAAGRHADIERQPVGAEAAGRELALQQTAGVCDRSHGHPL